MYRPLIRRWIGQIPGLGTEVDDVAQEVLLVLVREIPRFDRRREGSFRAWLRQITVNRVRVYRRQHFRQPGIAADQTDGFLDQIADSNRISPGRSTRNIGEDSGHALSTGVNREPGMPAWSPDHVANSTAMPQIPCLPQSACLASAFFSNLACLASAFLASAFFVASAFCPFFLPDQCFLVLRSCLGLTIPDPRPRFARGVSPRLSRSRLAGG
jgi:hypothetical protein